MMRLERTLFLILCAAALTVFVWVGSLAAEQPAEKFLDISNSRGAIQATLQPATPEQLARARAEWAESAHAETYDNGLGANTTCARCKSPKNWDPVGQSLGEALDCGACKRIPGAPRPELSSGKAVDQEEWAHIGCEICHQPVGDSFSTEVFFWDQSLSSYQAMSQPGDLCAHCHEGQHGFEVVGEQEQSPAHQGWDCIRCHGAHGERVSCIDCHDPYQGRGVEDHRRHPSVNCTGCHDAGGLSIWQDAVSGSRHLGTYITLRFAHTLTSWPSHNIQLQVKCQRCHHPARKNFGPIADQVSCEACHAEGAALFWCTDFKRDRLPAGLSGP